VPALQIRHFPDALYRKLAEAAQREHRSLSQQATVLLARALETATDARERRRLLLKQLSEDPLLPSTGHLPPPEVLIREDRER